MSSPGKYIIFNNNKKVERDLPPNDSSNATGICGETITAGNVLVLKSDGLLYKFDPSDESQYGLVVGISLQSVTIGNNIDYTISGLNNAGGAMTPGLQYGIANGGLSITPPISGIMQTIGIAINSTTIMVAIEDPLILI